MFHSCGGTAFSSWSHTHTKNRNLALDFSPKREGTLNSEFDANEILRLGRSSGAV